MRSIRIWLLAVGGIVFCASAGNAQEVETKREPTKLANLLLEVESNNPQIHSAKQEWQSVQLLPTQAATLPDPQVVLQQTNVGSPRPFAGFTNSDFAYIGVGVMQDIPYPGKLRLKGELAKKDADMAEQKVEVVRRAMFSELKMVYFRIAFLSKQKTILEDDQQLLKQMEQAAEVRYRSGMGNQQEVLQAQLEQTKLLREIAANQLEEGKLQAELKQLRGRPQVSPDILTEETSESALNRTFDELALAAQANNPQISVARKSVDKQSTLIELAKKDFYPDFNAQFMWQRTDPSQFRAYYQFTIGARIPIYRKKKLRPELAQAELDKSRAQTDIELQSQQVALALRQQLLFVEKSTELLKIYRDGLLPQAKAEVEAGFVAYQSNRMDFQALLASFRDVLKLDEEYWQTLSEHETALAQMEEITGVSLR